MMEDSERYTEICKHEFAELKAGNTEILNVLKGTNGSIGLCERVRANERFRAMIVRIVGVIGGAVLIQVILAVVQWFRAGPPPP